MDLPVKNISPKDLKGVQRKGASEGMPQTLGRWISKKELDRLQDQLEEARDTLAAIRGGEVDAVVVSGSKGNQIYSLTGRGATLPGLRGADAGRSSHRFGQRADSLL